MSPFKRRVWPVLWKKPLRDLVVFRKSVALLFIAMAAVLAAATSFALAWSVLERETERSFQATRPADVVLQVQETIATAGASSLKSSLLKARASELRVESVAAGRRVRARIRTGEGDWKTLVLFVRDDLENPGQELVRPIAGVAVPGRAGMLVERSCLALLEPGGSFKTGTAYQIKLPGLPATSLRASGVVYDGSQAPGWMENMVYAYVTPAALERLGLPPGMDEIRVRFERRPGKQLERQEVAAWVARTREVLAQEGTSMAGATVRTPQVHPHDGQMQSLLWTIAALGALTFLLASLLIATVVSAVLARQRRVLGVVKALGATGPKSFFAVAPVVLLPALFSVVPGVLLGVLLGRVYSEFAASILNVEVQAWAVAPGVSLVAACAVLLNVLVVLLAPFLRASQRPVHETLAAGESARQFAGGLAGLSRVGFFSRSLRYCVRNLVRRPQRSLATLVTLVAAGVVFLAASNTGKAWFDLLGKEIEGRRYDVEIRLQSPLTERVLSQLEKVEGLGSLAVGSAFRMSLPGAKDATVQVLAVDSSARAVEPALVEGTWLGGSGPGPGRGSATAIVLNRRTAESLAVGVGETLELEVNDTTRLDTTRLEESAATTMTFEVVGIVEEVWAAADAFVERGAQKDPAINVLWLRSSESPDTRFLGRPRAEDEARLRVLLSNVEKVLAASGTGVVSAQTRWQHYRSLYDHVVIFLRTFEMVCALLAAIGLFALGSMLSLSVLERSRELGVLRVLGATPSRVVRLVIAEGLGLVVLGFVISVLLSFPASAVFGSKSGEIFIGTPLPLGLSVRGYFVWCLALLVFGLIACVIPGRGAGRVALRDLLSAE